MYARLSVIAVTMVLSTVAMAQSVMPQGVTSDSIELGQAAAFSGPTAGRGIEIWRGMTARIREANEAGGINGRKLSVQLCDDHDDPNHATRCAVDLVTKRHVLLLTNTVDTPTMLRLIPLLQVWATQNVLIFGNATGAKPQRSMPAAPYIFNIRASNEQETAMQVKACVEARRSRIGMFVQNDALGKDVEESVRLAAKSAGAVLAATTTYERGAKATTDMSAHVQILQRANAECILTGGAYQAITAFVTAVRAAHWRIPIFAVSSTGADQLLSQLEGSVPTEYLVMTQVVPHFDTTTLPLVRDYRAAMDKYRPSIPDGVGDGSYKPSNGYSFDSLEAYLNTKVLGAAVAKAGTDLTRESFKKAAESLTALDVGLDKDKVTFAPVSGPETVRNHQGLKTVWLMRADGMTWKPIDGVSALAQQLVRD